MSGETAEKAQVEILTWERLHALRAERDAALAEVERVKWVAEVHLSRRGLWTDEVGLEIRAAWAHTFPPTPEPTP